MTFKAGAAEVRVRFFNEQLKAYLDDFLEKATASDADGTIKACAKLSQLGATIMEEYTTALEGLVTNKEEVELAIKAATDAADVINGNAYEAAKLGGRVASAAELASLRARGEPPHPEGNGTLN